VAFYFLVGSGSFDLVRQGIPGPSMACADTPASQLLETPNFRIVALGPRPIGRATGDACEKLRDELVKRWFVRDVASGWSPKCEIVLHQSDTSYFREVGQGGRSTVAASLVQRKDRMISLRRIDIRPRANWIAAALPHELTHVVVADLTPSQPLPRWLDEGIAILADPAEKQGRHLSELRNSIRQGAEFRLIELINLGEDYPPGGRWGAFYGQSASVVDYLIKLGGEQRLGDFIRLASATDCERALVQAYQCRLSDLERRWHSHLRGTEKTQLGNLRLVGRSGN
jgi:hypothetical protein